MSQPATTGRKRLVCEASRDRQIAQGIGPVTCTNPLAASDPAGRWETDQSLQSCATARKESPKPMTPPLTAACRCHILSNCILIFKQNLHPFLKDKKFVTKYAGAPCPIRDAQRGYRMCTQRRRLAAPKSQAALTCPPRMNQQQSDWIVS